MSDLVPEEAIERASYRLAGRFRGDEGQWRGYTDAAEVALEAAAPLILAAELDRLADDLAAQVEETLVVARRLKAGKDGVTVSSADLFAEAQGMERAAHELRVRASVLRGEGHRND